MRKLQALSKVAALGSLLFLAGCVTNPPAPTASPAPCPACPPCEPAKAVTQPAALPAKLIKGEWSDLPGWGEDDVKAAWPALLQSCRGMTSKPQGVAWKRFCEQARGMAGKSTTELRRFMEASLQPYAATAGDGTTAGMMTGYYEPLLQGSRQKAKPYLYPVLGVPEDLLTIDLSEVFPELKDKRVRGRLQGNKVVPYWSRAEIGVREDRLPGKTLAWVDDAVELFFLQVQGSGRIKLPDGGMMRVNYGDQNGHPYQSIGRVLVERGELRLEEASMQGIQAWARANPGKLGELLNANPSYVFFREVANTQDGPVGALGVPLTAERSIAIDPRSIPLGAPVFLATTRPNSSQPMNRLVLAQDTGGAIKGAIRADFFWGFGKEAGEQAGRMKQSGRLWVLLPPEAAPK